MVLKRPDLYSEIHIQHTVTTIGQPRQLSEQSNRWCIEVIVFKEENNKYPDFAALVKFLVKLAKEDEDLVYDQYAITSPLSRRHYVRQPVCRVTNVSSSSKCIS